MLAKGGDVEAQERRNMTSPYAASRTKGLCTQTDVGKCVEREPMHAEMTHVENPAHLP